MEQEDHIKRQIDQLGRVLGKILAGLTGLNFGGNISDGIEAACQALKGELDLDVDGLLSIPTDRFINTLKKERKMSDDNLEKLAGIFFMIADGQERQAGINAMTTGLFERSLAIFRHLDLASSTFSFDRNMRMEKLKTRLLGRPEHNQAG